MGPRAVSSLTEVADGIIVTVSLLTEGWVEQRGDSFFKEGVGGAKGVPAHLQTGRVG